MAFKLDVFDDFHLHGASAPEWNQRYVQISHGAMRSSLVEATSGNLHVFRKWMSERVVQQGCLPAGKMCFAVLNGDGAGTPRMQGHELREDRLFILRSGEEFTLQRPKGMDLLAVTFEAEELLRLLDMRPWPAPTRRLLLSRPALQAPVRSVQRLRRDLLALLAGKPAACSPTPVLAEDTLALRVVFDALGDLFGSASGSGQALGSASAHFIVTECHRIVAAGGADTPLSIDALCRRLRTSRRSVQNSFRQVADTTPVHYLRSLRLNAVRQRLMSTRPAELSVSQAAADQGFIQLSHFTERYKALFGELPSRTPRGDTADEMRVAA